MLRRWEKTCRKLGHARRTGGAEARLERSVATQERAIVAMLYKETLGPMKIYGPKRARSYSRREALP